MHNKEQVTKVYKLWPCALHYRLLFFRLPIICTISVKVSDSWSSRRDCRQWRNVSELKQSILKGSYNAFVMKKLLF